jgi:hypothetical protein
MLEKILAILPEMSMSDEERGRRAFAVGCGLFVGLLPLASLLLPIF